MSFPRPKRAARRPTRTRSPGKVHDSGYQEIGDGTRAGNQVHVRPAAAAAAEEGFGPFHHGGLPARDEDRRQDDAGVEPGAYTAAHCGARALDHERQAGRRVRGDQGVQLRHRARRDRPLPRQCLRAAGQHRHGAAGHHHHHPKDRGSRPSARAQGRDHDQAGPRHHGGRHRLGQVHHARGDDRLPERKLLRPHHHHRGPDRVHPPAQELAYHPARGRGGHQFLGDGAEKHPAPGAGRDPDRRDPRARNHGARHRLRRNRPPVPRNAARQQLQPGAGPDHQLLSRGAPPATAHGPVAQPARAWSRSG